MIWNIQKVFRFNDLSELRTERLTYNGASLTYWEHIKDHSHTADLLVCHVGIHSSLVMFRYVRWASSFPHCWWVKLTPQVEIPPPTNAIELLAFLWHSWLRVTCVCMTDDPISSPSESWWGRNQYCYTIAILYLEAGYISMCVLCVRRVGGGGWMFKHLTWRRYIVLTRAVAATCPECVRQHHVIDRNETGEGMEISTVP